MQETEREHVFNHCVWQIFIENINIQIIPNNSEDEKSTSIFFYFKKFISINGKCYEIDVIEEERKECRQ